MFQEPTKYKENDQNGTNKKSNWQISTILTLVSDLPTPVSLISFLAPKI